MRRLQIYNDKYGNHIMSRNINAPVKSTKALTELQNTNNGKLIFTSLRGRKMAFLIKNDRLVAAQVLTDQPDAIGTVYIGKIRSFSPNINAYFVEIEQKEMCFLPVNELCAGQKLKIGDELPVQIIREAQKTKLATVTARISLSNEYAAVSLGNPKTGYSRKLSQETKNKLAKWLIDSGIIDCDGILLNPPEGNTGTPAINTNTGLVIRTKAGECHTEEEKTLFLTAVQTLIGEFSQLLQTAAHRTCFSCIRKAPSCPETILTQFAHPNEYNEIITDDETIFHEITGARSDNIRAGIRFYQDRDFTLEKLYALDSKLETALERRVWLKSGGYLVIDPTEALTVIDVNSGKCEPSKGKTREDMILRINKEAAAEIALQLRLRNLSGIIIVDFINMDRAEDQKELLSTLTLLVGQDMISTSVVDMTPLGLVEITRKKINKSFAEQINFEKEFQENGSD